MEGPKWTDITIVALTGGIVFLAYMQWREMHGAGKQTADLIRAADIQAGAASKNAAAADSFSKTADRIDAKIAAAEKDFQRMAKASEDSLRTVSQTDQRAWIGVTEISGITTPQPEASLDTMKEQGHIDIPYTYNFKNMGKTPARYVTMGSAHSFSSEPVELSPKLTTRQGTLFPGQPGMGYSHTPIALTPRDMVDWTLGAKYVFVYVYIEYHDIFPDTKVHHTWACSRFDIFGKQTFCHIWNDAD